MEEEKGAWVARVNEASTVAELRELEAELAKSAELWARGVRFRILNRLRLLAQEDHSRVHAKTPSFLSGFGLPGPDGRRLYAYRLADDAYAQLERELANAGSLEALRRHHVPALFALWASEWFRRCYTGGGLAWAELVAPLGLRAASQIEQNTLRAVTERGLALLKRPLIRLANGREFLSTLAREGGFPTAAVEQGARGWAREILEKIVAQLLGEPLSREDQARELAMSQRARLPLAFQDDDFLQLCADLAFAIVELRREAEPHAAAAGIPVAAWLALNRPDWRDALPLTTGESTADALVDCLLKVEPVSGAAVGVTRSLEWTDDNIWTEAVRITLDGPVDGSSIRNIETTVGRLRAFASGGLARHLPGELALFEPPALDETRWSARSTRVARGIQSVPFGAAIELDLRAGEQRVARIQLSGGKPQLSELLVFLLEEGSEDSPRLLRMAGSGSGQYRAETVYVRVPADWTVRTTVAEEALELGNAAGESRVWRIRGGAFITDSKGDRFRVRCGQPVDQTQRIELVGSHCSWATASGGPEIFCGPPHAAISRGLGSFFIRAPEARSWTPAPRPLPTGHYELGLRHEGTLLDRRRIAVLPGTASLVRSGVGEQLRYDLSGFGPVTLMPDPAAPVRVIGDGSVWQCKPGHHSVYRFCATLSFPQGPDLKVDLEYPCSASVARWDGSIVNPDDTLTLDSLRDLVAIDRGSMELFAELNEPTQKRCAEMTWEFERELPLGSIVADVASLLLPASIDAWVTVGMHDSIETYWEIRQFPLTLEREGAGYVASKAVVSANAELCGRAISEPLWEVSFGRYSLLTSSNHQPARLPPGLKGAWLIYLRDGDSVLTRPIVTVLPGAANDASSALGAAMTQAPGPTLDVALESLLASAGGPSANDALIAELVGLAASLNGLPPATFQVLTRLPQHPMALARMAMLAGPAERDAVMALSDALPFAWCTIPTECWTSARRETFERALALLRNVDRGPELALSMVETVRQALTEREPLLMPVLSPGETEAIDAVTQRFLNRAIDRVRRASRERYRTQLGHRLPDYFTRFDARLLDTLDAPCAAALAALDAWQPSAHDIRHMKTVARTFPAYFAEAYAAWLKEQG